MVVALPVFGRDLGIDTGTYDLDSYEISKGHENADNENSLCVIMYHNIKMRERIKVSLNTVGGGER